MSIEINFERLEQLSIADLIAMRDMYEKRIETSREVAFENIAHFTRCRNEIKVRNACEEALEVKLKDIFILD